MKRRNFKIIALATAVATLVGLNLAFGGSRWARHNGFGHRWEHRGFCDRYNDRDSADINNH